MFKSAAVSVLLATLFAAPGWAGSAPQQQAGLRTRSTRDPARHQARLEKQVRHELLMLSYYSVFDNLAFRVRGDRVVLAGQVVRPMPKSDAEARVKKVEGVARVINRIEVLPVSPYDDRLRLALCRTIFSNSMLSRYAAAPVPSIHIIVRRGHVTLEGVASNETDSNVAYIQASSVPGVFSVKNNLRIEK